VLSKNNFSDMEVIVQSTHNGDHSS